MLRADGRCARNFTWQQQFVGTRHTYHSRSCAQTSAWNARGSSYVGVAAQSMEVRMKLEWHKPVGVEQQVGLEVTSYQSAELERT